MADDSSDDSNYCEEHASDTTRRMTGILAILVASTLSIAITGMWPRFNDDKAIIPVAGFPIDYWDWGANRVLTTDEIDTLNKLGSRYVFSLCGFIRNVEGVPQWEPEGRPSAPIPGKQQYLVVRIDAAFAKRIDSDVPPELMSTILQGWERNRTTVTIGLQLDCDVPTKKLAAYITFLKDIRRALPADIHLSITMLVDWIHSEHLTELMHVVDLVAPQFYNTYVPLDPHGSTPLLGAQDLATALAKLDAVGRPYRIGLPTYEQCSFYDSDGTLLKPAISLSPEQALTAGGITTKVVHNYENIIYIRFPQAVKAGGHNFKAGQQVVFASTTPQGLANEFAVIRNFKPQHCDGVLLFRLPGRESTHSLSIPQVLAAAKNNVSNPRITARLEPLGNNHYALIVSNPGDSDFIDFESPVRIVVHAPHAQITPNLLPHYGFTASKPISIQEPNNQHDGFELYIGLLRSGEHLTIEDMHIVGDQGHVTSIGGFIQRGDWTERF